MADLKKRCVHITQQQVLDVIFEAFNEDPYVERAAKRLQPSREPARLVRNRAGDQVLEFYVLDSGFEEWLIWHSEKTMCSFTPRHKGVSMTQKTRQGQISYAHRCHKRGTPPNKPEESKNTRQSKRMQCRSSVYSVSMLLACGNGDKVQFRQVRYNFRHNHKLDDVRNLKEIRLKEEVKSKIRLLVQRGKSIREVQEELDTWRNELGSQEGTQMTRANFITYDDVYHIYQQLVATKYQKHKDEYLSCQRWMDELQAKGYFVYKGKDGVCYGFSSPWQMQQLLSFGEVICFDGTHQTGGYVH
jgi:hypothetical protein